MSKVKVKIGDLVVACQTLDGLIDGKNEITPVTKFELLQKKRSLSGYAKDFDTVRDDAVKKYGKPLPDGNYVLAEPTKEEFTTKDDGGVESFDSDAYEKALEEYKVSFSEFEKALKEVSDKEVEIDKSLLFKPEDIFNKGIPAYAIEMLMSIIKM